MATTKVIEKVNSDLDLGDLVSREVTFSLQGKIWKIRDDLKPSFLGRIMRWKELYRLQMTVEITEEEEEKLDKELFVLASKILNIAVEEAEEMGSPACLRVIDFLVNSYGNRLIRPTDSST